jgi:hypothetical protein
MIKNDASAKNITQITEPLGKQDPADRRYIFRSSCKKLSFPKKITSFPLKST